MSSITNIESEHVWPDGSPHAIQTHYQQRQFAINLCAASWALTLYQREMVITITTVAFEYTEVDC
jgi:hypothetical protein